MTTSNSLSDTQLAILGQAAARPDASVLPVPKSLKARGIALQAVLTALIERSLIEEQVADAEAQEWRRDEDGRRLTLAITASGLAAIGICDEAGGGGAAASVPVEEGANGSDAEANASHAARVLSDIDEGSSCVAERVEITAATKPEAVAASTGEPAQASTTASCLRAGSTGAIVLQLLRRDGGVSIAEMTEASGWQAHSVRGFLSGVVKKKLGLEVASDKDAGGDRRYRIA